MAKTEYVLVYNDGFSSSRADFGDLERMVLLPRIDGCSVRNTEFENETHQRFFDIPEVARELVQKGLSAFEGRGSVTKMVGIFRGATVNLIDDHGGLFPETVIDKRPGIWSYHNKFSEEANAAFDAMMSPEDRYVAYGLPSNLKGSLIPGWTLVGLAQDHPYVMKRASGISFLPELFVNLFSEKIAHGHEVSYLGCHTGLYDFSTKHFSDLAFRIDEFCQEKTGKHVLGRTKPFVKSWQTAARLHEGIKRELGLYQQVDLLWGGHDTAMADVPVAALMRKAFGDEEFIHHQAGSWGLPRLNGRKFTTLPQYGYNRSMMVQADIDGNPVPTMLIPSGNEFTYYCGPKGVFMNPRNVGQKHDYSLVNVVDVMKNGIMVTPGADPDIRGIGPFPKTQGDVYGREKIDADESGETGYIAVNLMNAICTATGIELVSQGDNPRVVLSAGAAADSLYRILVASLMPNREVYCIQGDSVVTETAAYSGLVLAKANQIGVHPYDIDASTLGRLERVEPVACLIEPLNAYRNSFVEKCE